MTDHSTGYNAMTQSTAQTNSFLPSINRYQAGSPEEVLRA